jgi:hypothetical protein
MMSCVVGTSALVVFGLMATKQLRNTALFATANDYGGDISSKSLFYQGAFISTYLIITSYELRNSVPQRCPCELSGTGHLKYNSIEVCLFS